MQYLKDEVRKKITETALIEFRTKGFKGASIRNISNNSNVSVGNIYKYFKNKDDLFETLIGSVYKNAMHCIDQFSKVEINQETDSIFYDLMENILQLIEESCIELAILLNKSQGSSYENCKTSFVELITQIVSKTINYKLSKNGLILKDDFMINLISRNLVDNISEVLNSRCAKNEIRDLILSVIDILYGNIENKLPVINLREE